MEKTPFIAQLDRKIGIYRMEPVPNAHGDMKDTPVLIFETRAQELSNAGTQDATEKIQHDITAVFVIRKRNTADMYSNRKMELWETVGDYVRKYEITHVAPIQRTHIKINCRLYE